MEVVPYRLRENNFRCLLNRLAVTIDLGQPFLLRRVMNTYRAAGTSTGPSSLLSSLVEILS
jgi:hypothetical protein